ncbi:uncharacterized protein LOC124421005 [Lucilia cuprina]|uniref:uncharacterized protein LOC124421005 n=1 Tax=Lucilia cuprina TaxID=7375 RepID=UPI001F050EF2|nr:uncharacterized protein LOC124421005 [Lucilia cuprina]
MLQVLFRKCCRILWKDLSYHQHIIWLFLLILLSQQQRGIEGKPTKWNHSIQRRFMWKQMDSSVDGFVDRVVTGARVMKSMIGDFMPPKQTTSNVMDYLPTETTRIKYIIRNPHTKETKVIRVRPSKKVVKLMAMTPKPLMSDKPKFMHINEPEHVADKLKSMNMKDAEHVTEKFKSMYMINPEKLRQIEKEQELIAEGRLPMKGGARPNYMAYRGEKLKDTKDVDMDLHSDNGIVRGRIQEFHDSWKPVYKVGDTPTGFTTFKPFMMSALHTSVVGELLPEPQKQVYEPLTSNDFPEEEPKKSHTYEVTEYTAEESVVQPYTHEYYNQRNPTSSRGSYIKHSPVTTESPNIITQIEDDTATKPYRIEYHSQRGFLPSRGNYRINEATSTTTTTTTTEPTTTTTTTEEPNYPAIFLKKIRNRPNSNYNSKVQQRSKQPELPLDNSWIPSNVTYSSHRDKHISPYHQPLTSNNAQRTKSQKWPPDVEETYLNTEISLSYDISTTTEVPHLQEYTTQSIHSSSNSRKNVRLKTHHHFSPSFNESKHRNVRQRGSVKYGDRLEIEER